MLDRTEKQKKSHAYRKTVKNDEKQDAAHSIECITHANHSIAFNYVFALCDPVTMTLDLLT